MSTLHVSLAFASLPDSGLDEYALGVITGLTDNDAYPTLPVTLAALGTARTEFINALAATAQGGTEATATKNAKREILIGLLRQLANYVQGACNNVLATLLSSGFEAASTSHAQSVLETPSIVKILNEESTQLVVRATSITNAKAYEARISTTPGVWVSAGIHTAARRIILTNLTPGTVYRSPSAPWAGARVTVAGAIPSRTWRCRMVGHRAAGRIPMGRPVFVALGAPVPDSQQRMTQARTHPNPGDAAIELRRLPEIPDYSHL